MTPPGHGETTAEVADSETLVITPHGEIDLATVGNLTNALTRALSGPWRTVTIDLAETTFLGVVGSHPIEETANICHNGRRSLIIAQPRPQARWLLEWLGLGPSIVTTERLPAVLRRSLTGSRRDPTRREQTATAGWGGPDQPPGQPHRARTANAASMVTDRPGTLRVAALATD